MALRTPLSVTPHLYMGDSTGRPLDMGTVYFGEQDKDPEFYPINLFSDDELTKPLAQPVHTKGGYLYDKGDMVEPHAKEIIYSVKVLDSYGRKVFYKGAMMRNSWNDDVIEQINAAIVASTDVARQIATDITNDAINNTAVEGGVLADTFVTVTANDGQPATNLRELVSGIRKDFNTIYKNVYYAEKLGFKTSASGLEDGGYFDNSPLWATLLLTLKDGDIVKFNSGHYYFSAELVINKAIGLEGMEMYETYLNFPLSSGVSRTVQHGYVKSLTVKGRFSEEVLDPLNKVYGRAGLYDKFDRDAGLDGSYNSLEDVLVTGFDTGRLLSAGGTSIWAGAYRSNRNIVIKGNRMGLVCHNGTTHENFFGGIISGNSQVGVWAHANSHVSNIMFYGTTIEGNPSGGDSVTLKAYNPLYCNIYVGSRSHVYMFGTYEENSVDMVEEGGLLSKHGCFLNASSFAITNGGQYHISGAGYWGEYVNIPVYNNMNVMLKKGVLTNIVTEVAPKVGTLGDTPFVMRATYNAVPPEIVSAADIFSRTRIDAVGLYFSGYNIRAKDVSGTRIGLSYAVKKIPPNIAIRFVAHIYDTGGNYSTLKTLPDYILKDASKVSVFPKNISMDSYVRGNQLPVPAGDLGHYETIDYITISITLVDLLTGKNYAPRTEGEVIVDFYGINIGLFMKSNGLNFNNSKALKLTEGNKSAFDSYIKDNLGLVDIGYTFYRTDLNKLLTWNGTAWTEEAVAVGI